MTPAAPKDLTMNAANRTTTTATAAEHLDVTITGYGRGDDSMVITLAMVAHTPGARPEEFAGALLRFAQAVLMGNSNGHAYLRVPCTEADRVWDYMKAYLDGGNASGRNGIFRIPTYAEQTQIRELANLAAGKCPDGCCGDEGREEEAHAIFQAEVKRLEKLALKAPLAAQLVKVVR